MKIGIDGLADVFNHIIDDYGDEVKKSMKEILPEVAKETTSKLKRSGSFKDRKGSYRKGWAKKIEEGRTGIKVRVHNKTDYQLTHLLEFGHAKAGGGRTRPFPHIAEANEYAQTQVVKKLKERLGK